MKFYVNTFDDDINFDDTPYGYYRIGLFDSNEFAGYGSFCGWYARETYVNINLYACYVAKSNSMHPRYRQTDIEIFETPIHYDEVTIGSCYWERVIEADSLEEALVKFERGDFKIEVKG